MYLLSDDFIRIMSLQFCEYVCEEIRYESLCEEEIVFSSVISELREHLIEL